MPLFSREPFQPIHEFLVEVPGLADSYYKGEYRGFFAPSQIFDSTKGMVDEGVIRRLPAGWTGPDFRGKTIQFSYVEVDSARRGNTPQVVGHLLVHPDYAIKIDGRMFGMYLSCSRIDLSTSATGLWVPRLKMHSVDTHKAPELVESAWHTGCGIVDTPNDHYEVGETVWWGKPALGDSRWPSGFLVKSRNILMCGAESKEFEYVKKRA